MNVQLRCMYMRMTTRTRVDMVCGCGYRHYMVQVQYAVCNVSCTPFHIAIVFCVKIEMEILVMETGVFPILGIAYLQCSLLQKLCFGIIHYCIARLCLVELIENLFCIKITAQLGCIAIILATSCTVRQGKATYLFQELTYLSIYRYIR